MPKKAITLGALEISRRTEPGLHFVGGVAGLALQLSKTGAQSWILRAMVGGKRRDIGLGGYPDVTLADARRLAREKREMIRAGIDPVKDRKAAHSKLIAERISGILFTEAATQYIAAHGVGWKNAKHSQQWRNTLETYAYPVIGKICVKDIETSHLTQILEPIWTTKPETASRVRNRIELVLDWATARGFRKGENPARWKGHLNNLMPEKSRVKTVRHFPALPYSQVGAFMAALRKVEGMGARALEFTILTAARSGEVRGATLNEIDIKGKVWTVPDARMKAGKEHRIPLPESAIKLLQELPSMAGSNLVFPNTKGNPLSDMALTAVLRRMQGGEKPRWTDAAGQLITAHGFRSTFRDWAGETTAYPREVIEHALAHKLKDKAEAAYQRGTLFDKRRRLMDDWSAYCSSLLTESGTVVAINKASTKEVA